MASPFKSSAQSFCEIDSVSSYQMLPSGGEATLTVALGGGEWIFRQPNEAEKRALSITSPDNPAWPVIPKTPFRLKLTSANPETGMIVLKFMSPQHGERKLLVSILPERKMTYTASFIRQDASGKPFLYNVPFIATQQARMKTIYETATNVKFTQATRDEIWDFPNDLFGATIDLSKHWPVIEARIKKGTADRHLIYGWDFSDEHGDALGISNVGGPVCTLDHNISGQVLVHELGHTFGLGDQKTDAKNVMYYSSTNSQLEFRSFYFSQIEAINGANLRGRRTPQDIVL